MPNTVVQSESDLIPARTLPSDFAVPLQFEALVVSLSVSLSGIVHLGQGKNMGKSIIKSGKCKVKKISILLGTKKP